MDELEGKEKNEIEREDKDEQEGDGWTRKRWINKKEMDKQEGINKKDMDKQEGDG